MPPHNMDAERSVLGAMMMDANAVLHAVELLKPEDFYHAANREIFEAMLTLSRNAGPIDLVTLAETLQKRGTLEGVGGVPYLTDLSVYVPSTANVRSYIRIVDEKSTLRKLIKAGNDMLADGFQAADEVPEILERAEKAVYDIAMKKSGDKLEPISESVVRAYERIEQYVKLRGQIDGVPTGFPELDHMTTGFHPGELIIVAARPSMGKTALGLNIVQYASIYARKSIAVFSLEMPRDQLVIRMMCAEVRVSMQSVRQGNLREDDYMLLADAMTVLGDTKVFIDELPGATVQQIRSKARRVQMEHGLDMIMIDYIQLMSGVGKTESRQLEVAGISRDLKALAIELKVPVVALAQLSRAPAGRSDHKPLLSDLRDSGAIEQDADVVIFIHREDYYHRDEPPTNEAELIIAKQRNGPLGTVTLQYAGEYTLFHDPNVKRQLPAKHEE